MEKICENCKWWKLDKEDSETNISIGTCHRHSPYPKGINRDMESEDEEMAFDAFWPVIFGEEWCGDFEPK